MNSINFVNYSSFFLESILTHKKFILVTIVYIALKILLHMKYAKKKEDSQNSEETPLYWKIGVFSLIMAGTTPPNLSKPMVSIILGGCYVIHRIFNKSIEYFQKKD